MNETDEEFVARHNERMQVRWAELKAELARVPDDALVRKNPVGNLSFFDAAGEWLGYVDVYVPELVWFAE